MEPITVKSREVKQIIAATFPEYKKRKVRITPVESVTFHDVNWCDGSRNVYKACTIAGESGKNPNMGKNAPWCNPFEGATVNIPEGYAVVKQSVFCGEEMPLTVYVNPASMPKLITN